MNFRRLLLTSLAAAGVLLAWTCGRETPEPGPRGDAEDAGLDPERDARERRPAFFRLEPLETRLAPVSISLEATYDTQPALAVDAAGRPWAVWVGHEFGARDRLWSAHSTGSGDSWTAPELVTPADGEYLRPVLAPLGERMVCLWTATGAETGVWMSTADDGGWSAPERVSPDGHHQNPEVASDPSGGLWLVWQAAVPGGYELLLSRHPADAAPGAAGWSTPRKLTSAPGAHWDPALACTPDGAVSVVWSRFERGDYDLCWVRLDGQQLSEPRVLTDAGAYDLHPDLAADDQGRLWLAWDRLQLEQHGSSGGLERAEDGALINVGIGARGSAEVAVLCLDGQDVLSTATLPPNPPRTHRVENAAYPRLSVDSGGAVWLAHRVWGVKLQAPHSYWWDVLVMRCTAAGWSQPTVLPRSDGNLEEPAVVAVGEQLWVAAAMEHRVTSMPGNPHPEDGARSYAFDHHWNLAPQGDSGEIYLSRLGAAAGGPPSLRAAPALATQPALAAAAQRAAAWVERGAARHALEVDGERFELFFGDTHRHSNISRCTAGSDSTLADHYLYARDVMRLDFVVVSDHSDQTSDFNWWTLAKAAELNYRPGELVTLFGYEISNSYPTGHKNLIFPERPALQLRLGLDDVSSGPALWRQLEAGGASALTIPHTPAMPAGTDWEDHDPRYERLVEIFQARTGSSEHAGAPRLARSSINELGFVHRALDKGYRLGFIASTDHGHGAAYAAVYARGSTRADIYEALHAKRCYGATAYGIVLDVRANGRPMGSELAADGPVEITLVARAPTPLARAVLFAGSTVAATFELEGRSAEVTWTEPRPPVSGERAYYVRLELENDELAWSSPIWVTY